MKRDLGAQAYENIIIPYIAQTGRRVRLPESAKIASLVGASDNHLALSYAGIGGGNSSGEISWRRGWRVEKQCLSPLARVGGHRRESRRRPADCCGAVLLRLGHGSQQLAALLWRGAGMRPHVIVMLHVIMP